MSKNLCVLTMLLMSPAGYASERPCSAVSGPQIVPLIELYTSEGCSSCPPADRWLIQRAPEVASGKLNLLSWHVDYWDSLGWRDPFALASATERQRWQAARVRAQVYTPGVFLNGREWRGWHSATVPLPKVSSVQLALRAQTQAPGIALQVDASGSWPKSAALRTVLFERTLRSSVTRGENAGTALEHDFVVRSSQLSSLATASNALEFAVPKQSPLAKLGVLAMVQDQASGEIMQSLSLMLDRCAL